MIATLTVLICFGKMESGGGILLVCKEPTTQSGSGSSVQPRFSGGSGEEITWSHRELSSRAYSDYLDCSAGM
jgi:hypothetical protein